MKKVSKSKLKNNNTYVYFSVAAAFIAVILTVIVTSLVGISPQIIPNETDSFVALTDTLTLPSITQTVTICPTGTIGQGGCDRIGANGIQEAVNAFPVSSTSTLKIILRLGEYKRDTHTALTYSGHTEKCFLVIEGRNVYIDGEDMPTLRSSDNYADTNLHKNGICIVNSKVKIQDVKFQNFRQTNAEPAAGSTNSAGIAIWAIRQSSIEVENADFLSTVGSASIVADDAGGIVVIKKSVFNTDLGEFSYGGILIRESPLTKINILSSQFSKSSININKRTSGVDYSPSPVQEINIIGNKFTSTGAERSPFINANATNNFKLNIKNNILSGAHLYAIQAVGPGPYTTNDIVSEVYITNNLIQNINVGTTTTPTLGSIDLNINGRTKHYITNNIFLNNEKVAITAYKNPSNDTIVSKAKVNNNIYYNSVSAATDITSYFYPSNFLTITSNLDSANTVIASHGVNNIGRLNAGSPAINTGDPTILDPDGSRSDIGAYGGPNACLLDSALAGCSTVVVPPPVSPPVVPPLVPPPGTPTEAEAIELVTQYNLMTKTGGNFNALSKIIRKDFAATIAKIIYDDPIKGSTPTVIQDIFTDVNESEDTYIAKVYNEGLMLGCSTNPRKFCPNDEISRFEVSVVLSRLLRLDIIGFPTTPVYTDISSDSAGYRFMRAVIKTNLMTSCVSTTLSFCPENKITRGETAVIFAKMIVRLSDIKPDNNSWITAISMAYNNLMVPGNSPVFSPNQNITRSQLAFLIAEYRKLNISNPPATPTFVDVPASAGEYNFTEAVFAAGLFSTCRVDTGTTAGVTARYFCPAQEVKKSELSSILTNALRLDINSALTTAIYTDVLSTNANFKAIQLIHEKNIIQPCGTSTFCPDAILKRITIAESIYRAVLLRPQFCGKLDVDGDSKILINDLSEFLVIYNLTCTDNNTYTEVCGGKDSNKDGRLNVSDLSNISRKYGGTCS